LLIAAKSGLDHLPDCCRRRHDSGKAGGSKEPRRKDEAQWDGDYRTRRVILDIYDAMQESLHTGQPYQTRLDPPPADPRCCHPPRAAMPQHAHDGAAGTGAQQPTALQSVS
jgi:hypothetical protein